MLKSTEKDLFSDFEAVFPYKERIVKIIQGLVRDNKLTPENGKHLTAELFKTGKLETIMNLENELTGLLSSLPEVQRLKIKAELRERVILQQNSGVGVKPLFYYSNIPTHNLQVIYNHS